MKTYNVYMQLPPTATGTEQIVDKDTGKPRTVKAFASNLQLIGTVEASCGRLAIAAARSTFREFRMAPRNTLAAYPIVHDLSGMDLREASQPLH